MNLSSSLATKSSAYQHRHISRPKGRRPALALSEGQTLKAVLFEVRLQCGILLHLSLPSYEEVIRYYVQRIFFSFCLPRVIDQSQKCRFQKLGDYQRTLNSHQRDPETDNLNVNKRHLFVSAWSFHWDSFPAKNKCCRCNNKMWRHSIAVVRFPCKNSLKWGCKHCLASKKRHFWRNYCSLTFATKQGRKYQWYLGKAMVPSCKA